MADERERSIPIRHGAADDEMVVAMHQNACHGEETGSCQDLVTSDSCFRAPCFS